VALATRRPGGAIRLGPCPCDVRLRLFALGARSPTDKRGPWVYVTSLHGLGPQHLARTYRQRWRVEQAIEERNNGHDLEHLASYRLQPNQVALGFRLLARNLALGWQLAQTAGRPAHLLEPRAFRARHVEGLATFRCDEHTVLLIAAPSPSVGLPYHLPWAHLTVRSVA
jgi:Transposase DDE domain